MELEPYLARMRAALDDADATLELELGGQRETTRARLWHGQVLVDWEADEQAGGCLLRPPLLERLNALHARLDIRPRALEVHASGRIVAALSAAHGELLQHLGGAERVELRARLRFDADGYHGGEETYYVVDGAAGRGALLLRLSARVVPRRAPPPASPRSAHGPR